MNNNRNNNRRRGRSNNNRNQGGGNSANRIDSRARGNAPQLLDKYKKLAQDAQHNGDRVQAEYYLQFADHYFRVIADNKARQEEAKAKRDDDRGSNQSDDDDSDDDGDDRRKNRRPRARQGDDQGRDQAQKETRARRPRRSSNDDDGSDYEPEENPFTRKSDEEEAPKKRRAPRKPKVASEGAPGNEGEIDVAALPPAIGADEEKPAPRRRRRKTEESEDVSAVG
ncbi:DUF4167 domain-containing protein [Qipengyuania flava]|uniref:DUF4167 domain-containing protein n=1 Tax=Qipengyuania TaxID=1855416 RepID=UPI001C86F94F|nr:DUF4167 domain-containing protein [Qipengyuania aestuarii]MBX7536356.1 DUF4167 domain-containing protein [Qipengyuania aestuarii]MCA0979141.1 DUF4167 domain-containing protein [Qipengyuania flava]